MTLPRLAPLLGAVLVGMAPVFVSGGVRAQEPPPLNLGRLRVVIDTPSAREAIARVTLAEAAGQGDSGLAGVVYTILNRLASGAWGGSVDQVVNARGQFEPVMRAGGDWRALPSAGPAQRARIDTILNLALEGRLPDLTGGALFFQNPRIVAARAAAGTVSPALVHFGGQIPSAVIGDHSFYAPSMARAQPTRPANTELMSADGAIIVMPPTNPGAAGATAPPPPGERGLFVLPDGTIVEEPPR